MFVGFVPFQFRIPHSEFRIVRGLRLEEVHPQLVGAGGEAVGNHEVPLVVSEDQGLLAELNAGGGLEADLFLGEGADHQQFAAGVVALVDV